MTPTRDKQLSGSQLDTGIGSPVAERPNVWVAAPAVPTLLDTGTGSPLARRPGDFSGDAFVPPLWLNARR